jgi:hypothetical protein
MTVMTPEQRRKNRRTGLALLIFVIGVIAWTFWSIASKS